MTNLSYLDVADQSCRRIGKRRRDPGPVVGMSSEEERRNVIEKARELQHFFKYKNMNKKKPG
jgi:hypothetical protein